MHVSCKYEFRFSVSLTKAVFIMLNIGKFLLNPEFFLFVFLSVYVRVVSI